MGERLRQYEVAALLELLIARLQEPRFSQLTGADNLVLDLQKVHDEVIVAIGTPVA